MTKIGAWAGIIFCITVILLGTAWKIHAASRSVPATLMLPFMDRVKLPVQPVPQTQFNSGPLGGGFEHLAEYEFTAQTGNIVPSNSATLAQFTGDVLAHRPNDDRDDVTLTFNNGQLVRMFYWNMNTHYFSEGRLYRFTSRPLSPASPVDPGYSGSEYDYNESGKLIHTKQTEGAARGVSEWRPNPDPRQSWAPSGSREFYFTDSGLLSLQVMTAQDGRTKEITTCVGHDWHTQVFGPDGKVVMDYEGDIPAPAVETSK